MLLDYSYLNTSGFPTCWGIGSFNLCNLSYQSVSFQNPQVKKGKTNKMKFTALAFVSAVATSTAQVVIVPPGPVRGPNTLVFKEIGGVVNNECLTFTNNASILPNDICWFLPTQLTIFILQGNIVDAACALANVDRQVTPGKILGTDVLIIQRSFTQQFRPDLAGKTACVAFNQTSFRAEDCDRRDLLFARFDVGNGRIVANGHTACLSGHDRIAQVTTDITGRTCAQFTITAVTPTRP